MHFIWSWKANFMWFRRAQNPVYILLMPKKSTSHGIYNTLMCVGMCLCYRKAPHGWPSKFISNLIIQYQQIDKTVVLFNPSPEIIQTTS